MNYKLLPSDLIYLYDGCKHCFYLKVKHGIAQPSMPMASIFTTIANLQKSFYGNKRTEEFSLAMPPGRVEFGEKNVATNPLSFKGTSSTCYLTGRFDLIVKLDDGTYGVIDCKTAKGNDKKTQMYGRQLQAYTIALENPAPRKLALKPVTKLGLLYLEPDKFEQVAEDRQSLQGNLTWVEVPRDDNAFMGFLEEVVDLLDGAVPEMQRCDECEHCLSGNKCNVAE